MASNQLQYQLQLLTDSVSKSLRSVQTQIDGVKTGIKLNVSGTEKVGSDLSKSLSSGLTNGLSNASQIINTTIGAALANTITTGFSKIGSALSSQFESTAGLETTRLALNGLLGSADKAGKVLTEVVDFAKKTPFEIPELAQTAKLLAGYGVSAENIIPSLKSLGDAAAGTGTPIGQLARNFAQIQTQGKAGLIDLRQFAGAGVPIFEQLKKTLGKTKDEIESLASSGKITSADITKAFKDMSSQGGVFYKAMDNLSSSVSGRLSTLSDTFGGLTRKILGVTDAGEVLKGGLFDTLSAAILTFTDAIDAIDVAPFSNAVNSVISAGKLLFTGQFDGDIFGLAEDSAVIGVLFGIRSSFVEAEKIAKIAGKSISEVLKKVADFSSQAADNFPFISSFNELGKLVSDSAIIAGLSAVALSLGIIAVSAVIAAAPFLLLGAAIVGVVALFKNFQIIQPILQPIVGVVQQLFNALNTPQLWTVINTGLKLFSDLWTVLQPTLVIVGAVLVGLVAQIIVFGQYLFTNLYPVFLQLTTAILNLADAVLPPLILIIGVLAAAFITVLLPVLQIVGGVFVQVFSGIATIVTGVINIISGVINVFVGFLTGLITGDFTRFSEGFKQIWNGLGQFLSGIQNTLFSPIRGAFDGIANFIKGIDLTRVGLNFISNLATGIRNGAGAIGNAIRGAFSNITLPGGFKLPGFAAGVQNLARTQLAEVAERGRELIQYTNGQVELVNTRQTRVLPKGTSVYSNSETESILRNQKQAGNTQSNSYNNSNQVNNQKYINNYSSNYNQFALSPYLRGLSNI
jgi:tape measure domain-containing protein